MCRRAAEEPDVLGRIRGEPGGTRTRDPMIKSHVLYQLSYALAKGISYLIPQPFASLARLFV